MHAREMNYFVARDCTGAGAGKVGRGETGGGGIALLS